MRPWNGPLRMEEADLCFNMDRPEDGITDADIYTIHEKGPYKPILESPIKRDPFRFDLKPNHCPYNVTKLLYKTNLESPIQVTLNGEPYNPSLHPHKITTLKLNNNINRVKFKVSLLDLYLLTYDLTNYGEDEGDSWYNY